jgi:EAL domain-containing protein (putative c-di-GMP-specific phosphodiesterase class I)
MFDEYRPNVLLVDDDPAVARACSAVLDRNGWNVTIASEPEEALRHLKSGQYDAVVSDVVMPGTNGLEFLRAVRAHDADLPVILMTGEPNVESAVRALEYGAFHYLIKPFGRDELADVVRRAMRLRKLALLKRQALELPGPGSRQLSEFSELDGRYSRALEHLWIAFQPIVSWRDRRVLGFEALLRSDEPSMKNPGHILEAGERLGRLHQLGRTIRAAVAVAAQDCVEDDCKLFINLHSADLNDDELYEPGSPLSKLARRAVLEITERASLDGVRDVGQRLSELRTLGFQIAVDDLGAGYAGLSSFTQLEPEIAKLDMSLVRGIDRDPKRRSIVRSMKALCDDIGVMVVTEGVETPEERDALVDLGCDVFQGYLFAKPGRGFGAPVW